MLPSHHHNAGHNSDLGIFKNVSQFKYWGTTVTNPNLILGERGRERERFMRRLNSGYACYHSLQKILSSHLLSKSIRIRIHSTIILILVLYGCETWSLTLREQHRLRVFGNKVLRRIFGPKRYEVTGMW
jgi:hypothetical protein